jgi:hypothetical protein
LNLFKLTPEQPIYLNKYFSVHRRSVMRKLAFLALLALCASPGHAFDIQAHCQQVGEFAGGSYVIEEGCQRNEREAQAKLARMVIPERIKTHCQEVGQFAGGSYSIMLGCVRNEIEAKARLE